MLQKSTFVVLILVCCLSGYSDSGVADLDRGCTERGCVEGFSVDFQKQGEWPIGLYKFDFELNGIKEHCEISLPLSCDSSTNPCTNEAILVFESGCMLPAEEQGFAGFQIISTELNKVNLSITYNGAVLTNQTFFPEYRETYPNGPECPPVCYSAFRDVIQF